MAKPKFIEFPGKIRVPILWEDPAIIAVDKPPGWMLAPNDWVNTRRNFQLALESSMENRDHWAQSRNLKFIRYIHRLDADTSGVLLLARSPGALKVFSKLFEERKVEKRYLCVVRGVPDHDEWVCSSPLETVKETPVFVRVSDEGKDAKTYFRVLERGHHNSLLEACPVTGRTHQIRVHLAEQGLPIVGDPLYGQSQKERQRTAKDVVLGLRATKIEFLDPYRKKTVWIKTNNEKWLSSFGFGKKPENTREAGEKDESKEETQKKSRPRRDADRKKKEPGDTPRSHSTKTTRDRLGESTKEPKKKKGK
ncbi:RNA pseudouridine synthase [Verrucomicrobia bacterium]|nr:RNA pseudouridine synthase [Verrucomicrobiota bacterium]